MKAIYIFLVLLFISPMCKAEEICQDQGDILICTQEKAREKCVFFYHSPEGVNRFWSLGEKYHGSYNYMMPIIGDCELKEIKGDKAIVSRPEILTPNGSLGENDSLEIELKYYLPIDMTFEKGKALKQ